MKKLWFPKGLILVYFLLTTIHTFSQQTLEKAPSKETLVRLRDAIEIRNDQDQYFNAEMLKVYSVLGKSYWEVLKAIESIDINKYHQYLLFDYLFKKYDVNIRVKNDLLTRKIYLQKLFSDKLNLPIKDTKILIEFIDSKKYLDLAKYKSEEKQQINSKKALPIKITSQDFIDLANETSEGKWLTFSYKFKIDFLI